MLLVPRLALPPDAATLADGVAQAVRDGIAARELVPGEVYSVYQLADLLGVSRSPVREALLRLSEAGLVEISRNRGFTVNRPSAHDVEEIVEIRLALEPPAAARAATAPLPVLDDLLAAMRAAADRNDERAFWAADRALHRTILEAAGNARAAAIVESLRATTTLLGPPTTATGRTLTEIAEEHAPIVEAIVTGRADAARAAMTRHLEHTGRLLCAACEGDVTRAGIALSRG